jgi:DNA-binding MarR family transcriptional regulator
MTASQEARLFELADLILAVSRHIHAAKGSAVSGTPLEGAVMRFIDRNPGTSASAAAEATQLISSNFSRALRRLEENGLVRREVDPDDGRRTRLYPTAQAQQNLQHLRHAWSNLLDGTVTDPTEIATLTALLRRIETQLVEKTRRGD